MYDTHFDRKEFSCKGGNCCGHSAPVAKALVIALEVLRGCVGRPLTINSGFRCVTHNKSIGGAQRSQHIYGTAADVKTPKGFSDKQFYDIACSLTNGDKLLFGGVGIYNGRIHVDVRESEDQVNWDSRK